ncbi:MAG: hypothetical protein H7A01_18415 [Hahellaceae bacterium]|nr:hypothetical protein [Hahellaceae bacterium]MCP5213063.1 hypothetical protein [Hahellaceae bacterium]MCP5213068.1 hypothetical protein [Hahellaceae bacterium]
MTKVVREIVYHIKNERWLRGFVFNGQTIASAAHVFRVAGTNAIRRLFNKNPNDRISRKLLMASILYLFEQMADGKLKSTLDLKILTKIGAGLTGPDTEIGERTRHGHLFHLAQLALMQFENQYFGGKPILDIEAVRNMIFYVKPGVAAKGKAGKYNRTVDTVLGDAGNETWVELKSKQAPLNNNDFKSWSYDDKRSGIHKEFTADMVALLHKRGDPDHANEESSGLKWYFHKFKTKSNLKSPSETDIKGKIRQMCRDLVKAPGKAESQATFGIPETSIKLGCENLIITKDIGQLADVESLLIRFAENNLFGEFLAVPELD